MHRREQAVVEGFALDASSSVAATRITHAGGWQVARGAPTIRQMFRRRRPLLRAGMLAGSMYAAHEAGERSVQRQDAEAAQDQRLAALESRPPTGGSPLVTELTRLKQLLDAGALTPDEFASAKQKLLAE